MFITQLIAPYCHLAQSLDPFPNHFIKEAHRIGQGKCNGIDGQPMTNQAYAFAHQQVPSNLDQHCYYFCNIEFTSQGCKPIYHQFSNYSPHSVWVSS